MGYDLKQAGSIPKALPPLLQLHVPPFFLPCLGLLPVGLNFAMLGIFFGYSVDSLRLVVLLVTMEAY
jgi:hypothetical protein